MKTSKDNVVKVVRMSREDGAASEISQREFYGIVCEQIEDQAERYRVFGSVLCGQEWATAGFVYQAAN